MVVRVTIKYLRLGRTARPATMMPAQLMAPRIWTPLLVGMRPVPALQIPVHLPGSRDPMGRGRRIIWVAPIVQYLRLVRSGRLTIRIAP